MSYFPMGGGGGGGGGRNNPQAPPQLKPSDLFEKRRQRDNARLEAQNKILEQIQAKIRAHSKSGADPWLTQTVPPFILGLPKIDMQDCIVQLVFVLRQQTQEVRQTQPNLLQISWKHHEKEQIVKGSPIMQAMTPTTKSSGVNKGSGSSGTRVRFQEEVTTLGGGGRVGGRAPPRNTEDYVPPSSFLDVLERGPPVAPRQSALQDFLNF